MDMDVQDRGKGVERKIDLREHGISREQAADLRHRLSTFIEDWESPEMAIYDYYDESKIQKR